MLRIRRMVVALVLAGGVGLALTGCWEKDTSTEQTISPVDPLAGQKAEIAEKRQQAIKDHHQTCYDTFVKHPAFGFSRMGPTHPYITYPKSLQLPAGSEALNATPAGQPLPEGTTPWTVEKVELVSLMPHDKAGVYPAEGKVTFGRPKIRDLDDFEVQSLGALQNGEQVVILDMPGEVRMLGAIRARADCLKCHSDKKEKDLLGAFTYKIKPVGGQPVGAAK